MRPFGHTSGTLRAVAALVSLALTAAIFLLLRTTSTPPQARPTGQHVTVAVFASKPARPAAAQAPVTTSVAKTGVRSAPTPRQRGPTSPHRPPQEPAVASSGPAASLPAEALAASAPLRIDAESIARAIAGSEGNIRQMARRSGVALDSPRANRSEALADAVAGTGLSDCLAPNPGGSLLSAPILLWMAVQGKCK